jgi:hypothetical protein
LMQWVSSCRRNVVVLCMHSVFVEISAGEHQAYRPITCFVESILLAELVVSHTVEKLLTKYVAHPRLGLCLSRFKLGKKLFVFGMGH